jgi:hypothetical protein
VSFVKISNQRLSSSGSFVRALERGTCVRRPVPKTHNQQRSSPQLQIQLSLLPSLQTVLVPTPPPFPNPIQNRKCLTRRPTPLAVKF